jgi:hypothetical protein
MSLIFQQTPYEFQPVLSDGIYFTLSADTTNKFNFKYIYEVYVNGSLEFTAKAQPNPYGLGICDLQQVLETYCNNNPIALWDTTPIYAHQTFPFSRPYEDETISYYIKAGYEYSDTELGNITGFTGSGTTVGLPSVQSDTYKVFRSTMGVEGNANNQSFDIDPFVLSGTPITSNPTKSGLFLTNSPRYRRIDPDEYYTLAFTNYYMGNDETNPLFSQPYYVEYKFYDSSGSLIDTHQYENIISNGGGPRTTCSEVYQQLYLINPVSGTSYNTLYVGAGPKNISGFPQNAVTYTVQLFGGFTGSTTPIQPTPTPTPSSTPNAPTPTPSVTPSSTPICETCISYTLTYTGDARGETVQIVNCEFGTTQQVFLNYLVPVTVCSCISPLSTIDVFIQDNGPCAVTPTPTPTSTSTPTPTPSITVYSYLGRTTPDQNSGPQACENYLTVRGYFGLKPLASLTIGDFLYDTYPSSPTNGGGLWIALRVGGVGQGYAFQVDTTGEILDKHIC